MYIGNLLGSTVSHQANLGAVITDNTGLTGIEAYTIEAGEASGAAAFRMGYLAIASGYVDVAVVVGVEKVTDMVGPGLEAAASQVLDSDYEAMQGLTAATQAALIMRRYLYENKISHDVFATFPLIAHANAVNNPNAMYRKAISLETSQQAEPLNDPLTLFDIAPIADGAAAVILDHTRNCQRCSPPVWCVCLGRISRLTLWRCTIAPICWLFALPAFRWNRPATRQASCPVMLTCSNYTIPFRFTPP